MHIRIGCICVIFFQSEFSNVSSSVSSNCLPPQMQNHNGCFYVAFPYVFFLTNCWMFHKKNRSWWWQISTDFKKWYFPLNFAYFFWWIILLLSLKVFVSMDGQKMQHKVTQHLLNSCNLSCPVSDNVWVAEKLWLKYCFADSFCQKGNRPWVDGKVFLAKKNLRNWIVRIFECLGMCTSLFLDYQF